MLKKAMLSILFLAALGEICCSQQKSFVSLELPTELMTPKTEIFFYNGKNSKRILVNQNEKKLVISDSFYSPFAILSIHIGDSTCQLPPYNTFYISNKPSVVSLTCGGNNTCVNAYNLDSLIIMYRNYIKPEEIEFEKWDNNLPGKLNDSLAFEKNKFLIRQLLDKKLDFIKLHNTNKYESYFSFKLFKNEIAPNGFSDAQALLKFYEDTFTDTLRNSYEGKQVRETINGNLTAQAKGRKKIKAPVFSTTDIFGKQIYSTSYLGKKMILMNFWASWCGPCMAELPAIKQIQKKYSSSLKILSACYDKDSSKFLTAKMKYKMDWTNIYQDETLANKFGGIWSLPVLFLIDKDGNIIYNRSEDETDFRKLTQLNAILEKKMR